ncbi:hypothetical protein CPIN18021_0428 [Campylobacter pinnipediorum subsp. caledonicus]|uniref:Uncharacterized protein n=1 Tax=Campylobacter pinnipediorum subsp. caledonicus TaxID=1874362 RepID=A0A1S6U6G7_9BACT|nr:DNA-binding protein [Campylobacter pinnipediorum]AQW85660.1 hypothetical protein CPIN18020_0423 [Campylobacter pinnipediorum subsp. caledonicus]AQW87270.1 hypothetical protein CPIN18021_0428 [Campylobacter pinnipediorum subsp. caledonicus]OPA71798.1 transcriptional regulator [Campylobacter pinnipediorum subsp. caledonicus]
MQKMLVSEAADFLNITKEAVYNRIRRGSLKSIEENGHKFVLFGIDNDSDLNKKEDKKTTKTTKNTKKQNAKDSDFVEFLLNELAELKEKNTLLQQDKEELFRQKEQMLIEGKKELISIYKDRDEKLMQFLNAMQKPLLQHKQSDGYDIEEDKESVIDAQVDEISDKKYISLDDYLDQLNLSSVKIKKIEKKIIKQINKSKFVKFKNGLVLVRKNKTIKQILGEI